MEGDVTPYGMKLEGCTVRQCWDQVMQSSQIEDRLKSVEVFNAEHRHRKRGIAAVPTMFGISFTFRYIISVLHALWPYFFTMLQIHRKELTV